MKKALIGLLIFTLCGYIYVRFQFHARDSMIASIGIKKSIEQGLLKATFKCIENSTWHDIPLDSVKIQLFSGVKVSRDLFLNKKYSETTLEQGFFNITQNQFVDKGYGISVCKNYCYTSKEGTKKPTEYHNEHKVYTSKSGIDLKNLDELTLYIYEIVYVEEPDELLGDYHGLSFGNLIDSIKVQNVKQ